MTVTIRKAGPGDEAAVVRLVREMAAEEDYPSPLDARSARRFLASPVGSRCAFGTPPAEPAAPLSGALLAEDGGEAVGLLGYCIMPGLFHAADSGLIELLVVTASRRRQGIGRRLVDTALRLFREAGCAEASVSTGLQNDGAQRLYRAAGLTEASLLLEKHFEQPKKDEVSPST